MWHGLYHTAAIIIHAKSCLFPFLTLFFIISQGFFVVLSWMPIYFNSVRLIIYSLVIDMYQAIDIFRNQYINCV